MAPTPNPAPSHLPRSIWILGFVSLLMDVSSEIIHSLLPIYLVTVLGASALAVGLIESAANATAPIVKVFSGALIIADVILATANHWAWTLAGAAAWGLHLGMTQGLFAKMVADTAPDNLRGTAFGFFNLVTGAALFLANGLAGLLWAWGGSALTFLAGAGIGLAVIGLLWSRRAHSHQEP